ncbi:hypothetical protein HDU76_006538 [Blyttiomyces sp. JEL0837]|nr:hypothetical protein HDU76_006538 [Blyttiomyces sp. JEL0837]
MQSAFFEPLGAQQIIFPDLETITALTNRKRKVNEDGNDIARKLIDAPTANNITAKRVTSESTAESEPEQTKRKPGRKLATNEPTNKRTAQNRAAQRAFRERKEQYVRDLEMKVEALEQDKKNSSRSSELAMENNTLKQRISELETENSILRDMTFSFDFSSVLGASVNPVSTVDVKGLTGGSQLDGFGSGFNAFSTGLPSPNMPNEPVDSPAVKAARAIASPSQSILDKIMAASTAAVAPISTPGIVASSTPAPAPPRTQFDDIFSIFDAAQGEEQHEDSFGIEPIVPTPLTRKPHQQQPANPLRTAPSPALSTAFSIASPSVSSTMSSTTNAGKSPDFSAFLFNSPATSILASASPEMKSSVTAAPGQSAEDKLMEMFTKYRSSNPTDLDAFLSGDEMASPM